MIGTVETHLTYVPFAGLVREESPYRFHLTLPDKDNALRQSLQKSGQTHPLFLEETSANRYRVIDGHRRIEAIDSIREAGGDWERVWAHILPPGERTPLDFFRLIKERNLEGDNAYGVFERACFFKRFAAVGVPLQTIAQECGLSVHAVEDHIELAAAHPSLAPLLNEMNIEPVYALMLHHRFEGWIQSRHASKAAAVAQRILDHAKKEKITMKSWRFFLDFYWSKDRLFLDGCLKNT